MKQHYRTYHILGHCKPPENCKCDLVSLLATGNLPGTSLGVNSTQFHEIYPALFESLVYKQMPKGI